MNTEFRNRLTGAVILVLFFVLIVPAVLTGPRQAPGTPVRTAEDGGRVRSYTIDLTEPEGTPAREVAPLPVPASVPEPNTRSRATVPPPIMEEREAAAPQPEAGPETEPLPAPSRAPVAASVKPPAPAPKLASGFAVQIGTFGQKENADRLVAKLRGQDFPVYLSPTPGAKKLYRVRVGPVADRAEAQHLAARLAAADISGTIVPHP